MFEKSTQGQNLGAHVLDHVVGFAESLDLYAAESSGPVAVTANYSSVACASSVGCECTFSTIACYSID